MFWGEGARGALLYQAGEGGGGALFFSANMTVLSLKKGSRCTGTTQHTNPHTHTPSPPGRNDQVSKSYLILETLLGHKDNY